MINRQLYDDLARAARQTVAVDDEIRRSRSDLNALHVDGCQIAGLIVGERSDPHQHRLDHRGRIVLRENVLR